MGLKNKKTKVGVKESLIFQGAEVGGARGVLWKNQKRPVCSGLGKWTVEQLKSASNLTIISKGLIFRFDSYVELCSLISSWYVENIPHYHRIIVSVFILLQNLSSTLHYGPEVVKACATLKGADHILAVSGIPEGHFVAVSLA